MLEAKASFPTTSIAGGLFMLKRTIKVTHCGDPIKLDFIPERIYIFSGIFYTAFFLCNLYKNLT
ncbi:hypothetical protein [Peptoniphilus phoceensis]|uniref:hypothetical protein n=1 Tax=Peptoniphilus phoceensis TaxID=1720298 RepID=UPI000781D6B9|nr:hypothetical protein [Peptoniphilus phoceensis]